MKKTKKLAPTERESTIEKNILDWLTIKGCYAFKVPKSGYNVKGKWRKHSSKYAVNGISDIVCIDRTGRVLFLEVKSKNGVQSDDQKKFEENVKKSGGRYYVVRSVKDVELVLHLEWER